MKIPDDFTLFAWMGQDGSGEVGIQAVPTPLGINPAVASTEVVAEILGDAAQQRCNLLGTQMALVRFDKDGITVIRTISPQTN